MIPFLLQSMTGKNYLIELDSPCFSSLPIKEFAQYLISRIDQYGMCTFYSHGRAYPEHYTSWIFKSSDHSGYVHLDIRNPLTIQKHIEDYFARQRVVELVQYLLEATDVDV